MLAATLLAVTDGAQAAERGNVRLRYESTRQAVNRVLDSAAVRLARSACAALLDGFTATDGRHLSARLAELGVPAPAYLDRVLFYDGANERACARKDVLAIAIPGNPVVKVCPGFYQRWVREPDYAEATLIHEVFHTLGLGENPPSSREITARVMQACMVNAPATGAVADGAKP